MTMVKLYNKTFQYYKTTYHNTFCTTLFIILFLVISPTKIHAEETSTSEIKASWIYTIIDWLDWKNISNNKNLTICAVGRDKVYMYLKRMEAEAVTKKNRKLSVQNKSPRDDFKECHILYISESEQEYYMNMVEAINGYKGIVSISSIGGFARNGGSIEFVIRKKARLIINLKTIKNSKVIIDDELHGWVETIN